jgi:hypothetical protein
VKIKTLEQAKAYIRELEAERDALLIKAVGHRSDGTIDKYTDMDAAALRELIIKRGGDPDEIAAGAHSRGRSNLMRTWLRTQGGKVKASKPEPPKKTVIKPKRRPPEPPPVVKKRKKVVAEPVRKVKAKAPAKKPVAKPAKKPGKRKAM